MEKIDDNIKLYENYLCLTVNHLIDNWYNPDIGIVASALVDGNNAAYATSTRKDGKYWISAERNAYNNFVEQFGKPSDKAAFVSTLSPAIKPINSIKEISCLNFLCEIGIKRVHFGFLDLYHLDAIDDFHQSGLIPSLTQDSALIQMCSNIARIFDTYGARINTELPLIKKELGDELFSNFRCYKKCSTV